MIRRVENKKLYQFSLFWTLSTVILLSLIPEKKERYLLPVLIPLAMNTGFYMTYLIKKSKELFKIDIYLANFGFGLIGLIGMVFPFAVYYFFKGELSPHWTSYFFSSVTLFMLGLMIFIWLWKKNYEKCFYGIIMFISSIILFAFPMAELTYDNDEFLSAGTIREIKKMEGLNLYSNSSILAPELIYDLGEPYTRVKSINELPQKGKFGFMTWNTIENDLESNYTIELIAKFDINNRKKGKSGHKIRKTSKLYILEKKE